MTARLTPAMLALATAVLVAQAPPQRPQPPTDGPTIAVRGRVMDTGANRPVRGAQITLERGRTAMASTFSDFQGRWEIPEAPVGTWGISVAKSGYQDRSRSIVVPTSGPLEGIDLDIVRQGVIAGRIVDADGRPVVGASVSLLEEEDRDGETAYARRGAMGPFSGRSDDRGQYRLFGLLPGNYVVAVRPPAQPAAAGALRLEHGLTYAPGVTRVEDAALVHVSGGTIAEGIDITMRPAEPTHVEGRVMSDGRTCPNCRVTVLRPARGAFLPVGSAPLAPDGGFSLLGLVAGDYSLVVRGWDESTREMRWARKPLTVLRDQVVPMPVEILSPVRLPIRVVLVDPPTEVVGEDAQPWQAHVSIDSVERNFSVMPRTREMFGQTERSSGLESSLELRAFPGKYRLMLRGLEGAYIDSVERGGRPLPPNELRIPDEGMPNGLTIKVAFGGGTLEGTVDQPQELVTAGLKPPQLGLFLSPVSASRGIRAPHYGRVRPDGTFSEQVPPGEYDAVVMLPGQGGRGNREPARSALLKPYRKRLLIEDGETTRIELEVPKLN